MKNVDQERVLGEKDGPNPVRLDTKLGQSKPKNHEWLTVRMKWKWKIYTFAIISISLKFRREECGSCLEF